MSYKLKYTSRLSQISRRHKFRMMNVALKNSISDLQASLEGCSASVYIFGSRVWGSPKINSDLDIVIDASSCEEFFDTKERLEKSNCIYSMDFVNLNTINKSTNNRNSK